MDKFLIVDGNSIANRAFYALPFLSNHDGKPSGAVFGFANILLKIILIEVFERGKVCEKRAEESWAVFCEF